MSFSGEVKKELSERMPTARHCQLAELAALLHFVGQVGRDSDGVYTIGFQTEKGPVVNKGFTLLGKTFNITQDEKEYERFTEKMGDLSKPVGAMLIKNQCCRRAFLRGAFLAVGSINDPSKGYNIEFTCPDSEKAVQLWEIIKSFGVECRITARNGSQVVYIRDGESTALMLGIMEAPKALMELENARIYKEIGNTVNRRVNCETSNIRKTAEASARQIEAIEFLSNRPEYLELSSELREMAQIRMEYPELPLAALGEKLNPPVGKSGVNHRLRKLVEIADSIRGEL